jgi:apolipoprotein N-acyltransferase
MSQVIDASGRVLAQGAFFLPQVVDAEVALGDGKGTFFSRSGDWLAYLCLLGLLGFGRRVKHRQPDNEAAAAPA